jgi:hypothetical protein
VNLRIHLALARPHTTNSHTLANLDLVSVEQGRVKHGVASGERSLHSVDTRRALDGGGAQANLRNLALLPRNVCGSDGKKGVASTSIYCSERREFCCVICGLTPAVAISALLWQASSHGPCHCRLNLDLFRDTTLERANTSATTTTCCGYIIPGKGLHVMRAPHTASGTGRATGKNARRFIVTTCGWRDRESE